MKIESLDWYHSYFHLISIQLWFGDNQKGGRTTKDICKFFVSSCKRIISHSIVNLKTFATCLMMIITVSSWNLANKVSTVSFALLSFSASCKMRVFRVVFPSFCSSRRTLTTAAVSKESFELFSLPLHFLTNYMMRIERNNPILLKKWRPYVKMLGNLGCSNWINNQSMQANH